MNMFEKIFNRPKNPKEEEHDISIEANQHEFNEAMDKDEKDNPEDMIDKEKE